MPHEPYSAEVLLHLNSDTAVNEQLTVDQSINSTGNIEEGDCHQVNALVISLRFLLLLNMLCKH